MRNNAQTVSEINNLITDGTKNPVQITSAEDVKRTLLRRYHTLSNAAKKMDVDYTHLSHVLNGRLHTRYILATIQEEFSLSDSQIATLFPKPMNARDYKLAQASA